MQKMKKMIRDINIKNSIKRFFLYFPLIIESYYRLYNSYLTFHILHRNFEDFFVSLGYDKQFFEELVSEEDDQEIIYKIVYISLIVLACFSIVGFRLFQLLSSLLFMTVVLLYHNPVPQIKELREQGVMLNWDNIGKFIEAIDYELLISIGIGAAMIANAFLPTDNCEEKKEIEVENKNEDIKIKEEPKENKDNTKGGNENKDKKKKKKRD